MTTEERAGARRLIHPLIYGANTTSIANKLRIDVQLAQHLRESFMSRFQVSDCHKTQEQPGTFCRMHSSMLPVLNFPFTRCFQFQGIEEFVKIHRSTVKTKGYVESICGRRRYLSHINK